jgi:hypothetical protein
MPPHLPFGIGTKAANRNLRANVHYLISRHPKLHFTLNHYTRYQAYTTILIDGMRSRPFSMRTLPPSRQIDTTRAEIIRRASRRRYARKIATIGIGMRSANVRR